MGAYRYCTVHSEKDVDIWHAKMITWYGTGAADSEVDTFELKPFVMKI
jgi:hypothetical protein